MDNYGLDEEIEYREGINPLKVAKGLGHGGAVVLGGAVTSLGQVGDFIDLKPKGQIKGWGKSLNDLGVDENDTDIDYILSREGVVMLHPLLEALALKDPAQAAIVASNINAGITENRGGEYTVTDRAIDYLAYQTAKKGKEFSPAFKEAFDRLGTTYNKKVVGKALDKISRAGTGIGTSKYLHKAFDDEYKYDDY